MSSKHDHLDRRSLLRGLLAAPLVGSALPLRAMERAASMSAANAKVLFIFLRGGLDGVVTLIPYGDGTYAQERNIGANPPYIPRASAIFLTQYAGLNPVMGELTAPTGPWGSARLALIHQVGNHTGDRSHFTEMSRLEVGDIQPAHLLSGEGFVPRLIAQTGNSSALASTSVSGLMQKMFQTTMNPQFHVRDVEAFAAKAFSADVLQHLGQTPTATVEASVDRIADLMVAAHTELTQSTPFAHDGAAFPYKPGDAPPPGRNLSAAAQLAGQTFFRDLEGALHLLEHTSCEVAGVELGGFDTHRDEMLRLNDLLEALAYGMRSVWDRTMEAGLSVTTLAMSEFGRTARTNGNAGTDHGMGGVVLVAGPRVKGNVYNCSLAAGPYGAAWVPLANQFALPQSSPSWNAVPVATHVLGVLGELLTVLYGVNQQALSTILPGYLQVPASLRQALNYIV